MQIYSTTSSFDNLPITTFWYPARNSRTVVLLLKGIYGLHEPESRTSWESELISRYNETYHFVCVNAARRAGTLEEQKSKEAFVGKTYAQEYNDVIQGFEALVHAGVLPDQYKLIIVGNSFGGTVLLGLPELLQKAASVIFIGSGCGRGATTTKPLLSTMPEEDILLAHIEAYTGLFAFVRGDADMVVPKESQDKIIARATSAKERLVCEVRNAAHDLTVADPLKDAPSDRTEVLVSLLAYVVR